MDRVPWYDALLAVLSLIAGAYVVWEYPNILAMPAMTPTNVTLGGVAMALLLEATRLTRASRLTEATTVIQRMLQGETGQLNASTMQFARWKHSSDEN